MLVSNDYLMRDTDNLDLIDSAELHDCDVWAGYLAGDAEKVWPDTWWKRVSDFPKLPIYVARTDKTGTYCGLEAIMAIYKLGIPRGTTIAADIELFFGETPVGDPHQWLSEFATVLRFFDYDTWKYGSVSYLFDLPNVDGSWVATDSKIEEQYHHSGVHATQYLFGTKWDSSLIHRHAVHSRLAANWGINH